MQKFQRDYVDLLANASYVALLLIPFFIDHPDVWQYTFIAIAVVAVIAWTSSIYRYTAISSQPISKISSSAQGYVEILGKIKYAQKYQLKSPSGESCVWYRRTRYEMQDNRSTLSNNWFDLFDIHWLALIGLGIKENIWRKTAEEVSEQPFMVEDGSGECLVKPQYADFFTKTSRDYFEGTLIKFEEELLVQGEKAYILGEFKTYETPSESFNEAKEASILLAEWKVDTEDFHRRFDENKNGMIDLNEWEKARRMALKEVHRRKQSHSSWHEISNPQDGRMFLISTYSPSDLKSKFLGWSLLHLVILIGSIIFTSSFQIVGLDDKSSVEEIHNAYEIENKEENNLQEEYYD